MLFGAVDSFVTTADLQLPTTINTAITSNNDDLNPQELQNIFSLIDTSNLNELTLITASTNNMEQSQNNLIFPAGISFPFIEAPQESPVIAIPEPPPKIIFTGTGTRSQTQVANSPKIPYVITDNRSYLAAKKKDQPKTEIDGWENFRWEQWEEKKDPLAAFKSPPYVDGFGELKVYSLVVNADNKSRSYALNDEVYKYLSGKVKEVAFQIDYRFNLLIQAKISDEAEVYYNVSQEPDQPQKTDVSLKVRQTWVKFGYSEKSFRLGSFTDVSKKIDGVSVEGTEGPFAFNFAFGAEKSKEDTFSRQGNGSDEYELRNKPVLEKSVQVWVNDRVQILNKDYTVNYFEGKIVFATSKTSAETLKFSYQYTNPIEEFIPIASNVNLIGMNAKYDNKYKQTIVKKIISINEKIPHITENGEVLLKTQPIELDSEKISANNLELKKNIDYYIQYSSGTILFQNKDLTNISIVYQTPETKTHKEKIQGNGNRLAFYLKNTPLLNNSEILYLQGNLLEKNKDYKIENEKGMVVLKYPIPINETLSISYRQLQFETKTFSKEKDSDYDLNVSYIRQFAKSQEDINTKLTSEKFISTVNFGSPITINLKNWPILKDSVSFLLNDTTITFSPSDLEINNYTGYLTLNATALNTATGTLQINYSYYKEFGPQQWNFSGSNKEIENYIFYNNKLAHRVKSNLSHPIKYDPFKQSIKVEYKNNTDIYKTLKAGLDYDIEFDVDPVKEGQIYLILYHEKGVTVDNSLETVMYGLPSNLGSNDLFKITYYYTNSNIPDAGEIINEQFAMLYNQKLNQNFGYSVEVARSHKEYTKTTKATTDVLVGTGEFNKTYSLTAQNIVENSETAYLNGNVAIRDMNYYINYNTGQITFISLNPGPNDNIRIEYSYFTKSSGGESVKYEQSGSAIGLKANLKGDIHDTNAQLVFVDDTFDPVGSSQYQAGSNIFILGSKINPSKELNINTEFFTNKMNSAYKSTTTGEYLKYHENKFKLGAAYSPLDIFSINGGLDIQNYETDINVDNSLKPIDRLMNQYYFSLSSGPSVFKTNFSINNFSNTDKSNRTTGLETLGRSLELNNDLILFANDLRLISTFKETTELQASGNQSISDQNNRRYGFDLGVRPISFLRINGNYSQDNLDKNNYQSLTQNATKEEARNYGTNISLAPPIDIPFFQRPDYGFALSNTEKQSLLSSYSPDTNKSIGNKLSFGLFGLTSISLRNSIANSLQSNEKIKRDAYLGEYTINGFSLFNNFFPLTLKPFSRKYSRSSAFDSIGNLSTLSNVGETWGDSTISGLTWSPIKEYNGGIDYTLNQNYALSTENKTIEVIHSTQTKPNSNLQLINNLQIADILKTSHIYNNMENKEQKLTYYLATSNLSVQNILTYNNTSHLYSNSFKNVFLEKIHPVYLNNSLIKDDYIDTSKGLKLREQENYEIYSDFLFLDKLTIKPKLNVYKTDQFTTVSDNYSLSDISSIYNQRIYNNKLQSTLGASYPFIEKTNLLTNVGYDNIKENVYNRNSGGVSEDPKEYDVYSLGVGVDTTIIDGLFLKGTYTLKNSQDKKTTQSLFNGSETIRIEGTYKPATLIALAPVETVGDVLMIILNKSTIGFMLEYNKGTGINSYTLEETEKLTGKTVETKIEKIDNLRIKGSFESQIEVPLTEQSSGMIEKFVFSSEAHIVIKNDYANIGGISYTVLGLIFSGKLIF